MLGRTETRTRERMYCQSIRTVDTSPETIEGERTLWTNEKQWTIFQYDSLIGPIIQYVEHRVSVDANHDRSIQQTNG